MAYRLDRGVNGDNEMVQRGLLIGLPLIAILLSLGAIAHHRSSDVSANPQVIPVVSSVSHTAGKSSGTKAGPAASKNNGGIAGGASSGSAATGTAGMRPSSSGGSPTYSSAALPASSGSGGTPIIGGRGGGPSGGATTASGGSDSGSTPTGSTGGTLPLNTTLTIPPVSAGTGDKSILDTSGTTLHIN